MIEKLSRKDIELLELDIKKERKFKVGDKVRVTSIASDVATVATLSVGDITEVVAYKGDFPKSWSSIHTRPVVVKGKLGLGAYFDESALELIVKEEKTPNNLRAETIKKAREFVGDLPSTAFIPMKKGFVASKPEFVINEKERTVTALFTDVNSGIVAYETVAKCHPKDVFNADIGKAIAWGRALNKDVTDFENAVQPTIAKGQECIIKNWKGHNGKTLVITKVFDNGKKALDIYKYGYLENYKLTIIDDTNAQYERGLN